MNARNLFLAGLLSAMALGGTGAYAQDAAAACTGEEVTLRILRTPGNDIRTAGRATQGVRLMDLEGGDRVVSVALVPSSGEDMADEAAVEPLAADPSDGESGPEEPQV